MADTLCNEENIKKFFLAFYLGKQNIIVDGKRPDMNREIWRTYLSDLLGNLSNDVGIPDKTFTIRDDNDVDQTYTVNNNNTITLAGVAPVSFAEFLGNKKVSQLKVIYKAIIRKCDNIFRLINRDIITELFLTSTPQPSERNNINFWKNFFSVEERYNAIKKSIDNDGSTDLCEKSFELLQDEKKNGSLKLYVDLINKEEYQNIITEINRLNEPTPPLNLNYTGSSGGRNSIMPLIFLLISSVCGGGDGNNLIPSGLVINQEDRTTIFSKDPATVDPRQFLAIEKFTKFRKKGDKACFLFHGVGTGKTITSISIALGNLTDENLYNNDGQGNDNKKPLKVLVFAPQGLFYSAFMGDAEKMSIYTSNNYFIPLEHQANGESYSFTLEKFDAQIKNNEDSYYSISFVGFNYIDLFSDYGFEAIKSTLEEEKYDVLICDEAHQLLTSYIKPNSKDFIAVQRDEEEKNFGEAMSSKGIVEGESSEYVCISY